jgi:hypothetical protein
MIYGKAQKLLEARGRNWLIGLFYGYIPVLFVGIPQVEIMCYK